MNKELRKEIEELYKVERGHESFDIEIDKNGFMRPTGKKVVTFYLTTEREPEDVFGINCLYGKFKVYYCGKGSYDLVIERFYIKDEFKNDFMEFVNESVEKWVEEKKEEEEKAEKKKMAKEEKEFRKKVNELVQKMLKK